MRKTSNRQKLCELILSAEKKIYAHDPYVTDEERIKLIALYLEKNNVIILPCAIGQTVYIVNKTMGVVFEGKFRLDDLDQFGKRVFLTRTDAYRYLRGRGKQK